MPNGQVDPAGLEGEALRRWYLRTPDEVREERQAAEGVRYGSLYAPVPDDLATLRRQQAEFEQKRQEISKQNSWMAVPALAPAAAIVGLEAAAAMAARIAPSMIARGPLVLTERMPALRGGDNWATRAGRRAHQALKTRVDTKSGWQAERSVRTEKGVLRPDVSAPARNPAKPDARYQMELKPDTASGRRAGAKAAERYTNETGNKTRPIYYNPKDFM